MTTLTEDDTRRKPERNSNGERSDRGSRAADFARHARSLVAALFLISGLAACGADGITGTPSPRSPARNLVAGQAQADVIGDPSGEKIPVMGDEFNRCNGMEPVPFRGYLTVTAFVSDDDVFHQRFRWHYVFDGTGGFGNVYHGSETFFDNLNVSLLPLTQTIHHHIRMTSPTAPDMMVTMKVHITITPSGRTVTVEKVPETECRG